MHDIGCKISHIQNISSPYLPDYNGQTLLGNLLITQLTYSRFKLFLNSQSILKSSLYIGCSDLCHGDMTHHPRHEHILQRQPCKVWPVNGLASLKTFGQQCGAWTN